jgi:hypothetical protein
MAAILNGITADPARPMGWSRATTTSHEKHEKEFFVEIWGTERRRDAVAERRLTS